MYERVAEPCGVYEEISRDEFARVLAGEGANAHPMPLDEALPQARSVALFAGTLGPAASARVSALFDAGDPALGFMLDAVLSEATDRLANGMAALFGRQLAALGRMAEDNCVLTYSPGYCGWHLTGQRALFARFAPEPLGITLGEGCSMRPLKSVSGALVAGPARMHVFEPRYAFCRGCRTRECRARAARLPEEGA